MFVGNPSGNYDRILDSSTALTGALFFIPTMDFLDDPPPLPANTP
jgi:putative iron-dependent peroxidase